MNSDTLDMILRFISENNVLWLVLVAFGMYIIGKSVPAATIENLRGEAAKTETPLDDALVAILEALNSIRPAPVGDVVVNEGGLKEELDKLKDTPLIVSLPKGTPANMNPNLNEIVEGLAYYEEDHGGRKVAIPHHYDYFGEPGLINGKESPHPDVFYKAGKGFEFAIAHKAGRFGYGQMLDNHPILAGKSRYALIVKYSHNFTPYFKNNEPVVYVAGRLSCGGAVVILPDQVIAPTSSEAIWVIEALRNYENVGYTGALYLPWASVEQGGIVTIEQIKFVPVADDFGGENVIRI